MNATRNEAIDFNVKYAKELACIQKAIQQIGQNAEADPMSPKYDLELPKQEIGLNEEDGHLVAYSNGHKLCALCGDTKLGEFAYAIASIVALENIRAYTNNIR